MAAAAQEAEALQAELLSQLQQLKRATLHYQEKVSRVASVLSREQSNYEDLKRLYEEQSLQFNQLLNEHVLWKYDVEKKREQVRCLRDELERVTSEWRKARAAELQNKELEENNRYLERLVITVAVSIPMALLAEKQFRSKL